MPAVMEALRRARSADRSQTGAVATNWVVLIVIAWVATLGLWYSAHSDAATQQTAVTEAKAAKADAEKRLDEAKEANKTLSHAVGYRDESNDTAVSDLKAMQTAIDGAKTAVGSSLGGAEAKPTL
jgi:predicted metal-binding membrane protein